MKRAFCYEQPLIVKIKYFQIYNPIESSIVIYSH